MRYFVFESGSKGNCTLIVSHGHHLVIDNGLSNRKFKNCLASVNVTLEEIDAVLLTHNHSDHIAGVNIFSPSIVYASKPTYKEIVNSNILHPYNKYRIAGFQIETFPIAHDAPEGLCFIISDEQEKMVYCTDTGFIPSNILSNFIGANYYIFEANHDPKMQLKTNRPMYLINRIMGDHGHLSNEDSALYLSQLITDKTREITLAHLSEEANSPEVALATFNRIMALKGVDVSKCLIRCAKQHEMVSGGLFD